MMPDKIYIQIQDGKTITTNRIFATDIEYIRKDALLEWLESKIKDLSNGGFVNGLTTLAYKDVVEHINEM